MKTKHLLLIVLVSLIMFPKFNRANADEPKREFRGVWVATVANIDWPTKKGLSVAEQKDEMLQILDTATALHLNAIIFQVRPEADALYDSKIEPWSRYITGTQGQAPEPYYDPLTFAVEEAHKRCLEIHAWLNPYRASINNADAFASNHVSKTKPEDVYTYGKMLWMDPGKPEVRQQLLNVIDDLITRYDLDGIHFDDYFYPYPIKGEDFPDKATYASYTSNGGNLALDDWRRENVDTMVKSVYELIKKEKPWVKFGISPFGIWQPGYPEGIAGLNSYAVLYADARKWLQEGWVDYLTPQLYWKILASKQSYPKLMDWWVKQNTKGRDVYVGNNISNVGGAWPATEIIDQIDLTRQEGGLGNIHFSMKTLVKNSGGLSDQLFKKVYQQIAIPPAMPWLDSEPPKAPKSFTATDASRNKVLLRWEASDDTTVWQWALYKKADKGNWEIITLLPVSQNSYFYNLTEYPSSTAAYGITALDRLANESERLESRL